MKITCAHKLAGGTYTRTVSCGKAARSRIVCLTYPEVHDMPVCGIHERFWRNRGHKFGPLNGKR